MHGTYTQRTPEAIRLAILLWLMVAATLALGVLPAHAIDLATAFGSAIPLDQLGSSECNIYAAHSGATTARQVIITANGVDSAVISLLCGPVSVTRTIPSITVNGRPVANVAFPQTVTSTGPGIWVVQVGSLSPFTILAQ